MGTAHGTQWRRRWTASRVPPPFPARNISLLAIFGGTSGARTSGCRPKPPFWNRRSVVAAVVTMPPGVKTGPVCIASRRALRCRRRCNLPDGYIHCYYAARLPGFSVPSRPTLPSPDGRRQRRRQEKRLRATFFLEYRRHEGNRIARGWKVARHNWKIA